MGSLAVICAGFVENLYKRSMSSFADLPVIGAFCCGAGRSDAFRTHWNVSVANVIDARRSSRNGRIDLVLNLMNARSHGEASSGWLEGAKPVYSAKPFASEMAQAFKPHTLAKVHRLELTSRPCRFLSEAARTAWRAARGGKVGKPVPVCAELANDLVPIGTDTQWVSETGARRPHPISRVLLAFSTADRRIVAILQAHGLLS